MIFLKKFQDPLQMVYHGGRGLFSPGLEPSRVGVESESAALLRSLCRSPRSLALILGVVGNIEESGPLSSE